MSRTLDLQFSDGMAIDRELVFALVTESMSETERAFGRSTDGRVLERYALDAAIDLLSRPAKVHAVGPELAAGEAR